MNVAIFSSRLEYHSAVLLRWMEEAHELFICATLLGKAAWLLT
jgi:hypothetical protein